VITGFSLTPANGSEREAVWDVVQTIQGLLIGEKGYLSVPLQQALRQVGVELETALRSNMHDTRDPAWVALLKRMRRLIETVIGQLVERFSIEKIWARDLWHLSSRFNRKLLAHTVCHWLNRHSLDRCSSSTLCHSSFSCTSRICNTLHQESENSNRTIEKYQD
jgi:hypothetical protein